MNRIKRQPLGARRKTNQRGEANTIFLHKKIEEK